MTIKKSVLVIGAGGFTGRYVTEALQEAMSWVPFNGTAEGVNILDCKSFTSAVERIKPDAIINLAAVSTLSTNNVPQVYQLNGLAVVNMLDALARINFQGRFITASSALVYGANTPAPIAEVAALRPEHHYSVAKAMADRACEIYREKLDVVVSRPFNCIGIGHQSSFVVPKIVSHFRKRENSISLGNVDSQRDFVDIRDVANMYLAVLNTEATPSVINFCSGKATSIQELISRLSVLTGHKMSIHIDQKYVRENDNPYMCGDNTRLLSLDFDYQYDLNQTLDWMYKDQS